MSSQHGGRDIHQDMPVDSYMQSSAPSSLYGYYPDPFYPAGGNDNVELADVNYGVHSKEHNKPVINPQVPALGEYGKHKVHDVVSTASTNTGLQSKVDQYINSILAEGPTRGEGLSRPVDHAEIVSFLDSQFRVALDPLLISSIASVPVVSDSTPPKETTKPKKKRKQSALTELEPEIERELSKYPAEERDKQRKILKNRLAARTFRKRQKEHIAEMSHQIDSLTNENMKLRSALKLMAMENKMVKEQLGYIKSFLAPFGNISGQPMPNDSRPSGYPLATRDAQPRMSLDNYLPLRQSYQPLQRQPAQHLPHQPSHPYVQYTPHSYSGPEHVPSSYGSFQPAADTNEGSIPTPLRPESYFNMETL